MFKSPIRTIIIVVGVIVFGAVGWYLAAPLFINDVVDESFPITMPSAEEIEAMSDEEKAAAEAQLMEAAAAMPDTEMEEAMPGEESAITAVKSGEFVDADSFHQGSGVATIYDLGDGTNVLRFEDFEVTNGPDLHVLLAKHPNPTTKDELEAGGYIDLGSLKGNIGNQNYEIPADIDVSEYGSIVIYCMPFHVFFSNAPLQ